MKRLFQVLGIVALLAVLYADLVFAFCLGR